MTNYVYKHKAIDITIGGISIDKYKIIIPRAASYIYTCEIYRLLEILGPLTAQDIEVTDERTQESAYEIVIGDTTRDVSQALSRSDAYEISVKGTKLVINAGGSDALASAVIWLTEYIKKNGGGNISFPSNFSYSGTYSYTNGRLKLVWNDEFNGDSLDTAKWRCRTDVFNGVQFTDTTENTYVSNGTLKQIVRQSTDEKGEKSYTGSWLYTDKCMGFMYGYAEIMVKMPKGKGVFPAFWANYGQVNGDAMLEIDIFELFPGNDRRVSFTLHYWWMDIDSFTGASVQGHSGESHSHDGIKGQRYVELENGEKMNDAWHTVGLLWDEEGFLWMFDGIVRYEFPMIEEYDSYFHSPVYFILNHIIVPESVGKEGETPFPNVMETDYIRLYQISGRGELIDLSKR